MCGLIAQSSWAYERPLPSESVREAYFLGERNDRATAEFLTQYVRRLPMPKSGPHVAQIEISTPYRLVVARARRAVAGYSAQQAEEDYRARPNLLLIRVRIDLTPTFPGYKVTPDFWRDFSIRLVQDRAIPNKKVTGHPIYNWASPWSPGLVGAEVDLEYDAAQIASAPVQVDVLTPDGQHVRAEFDLAKLR